MTTTTIITTVAATIMTTSQGLVKSAVAAVVAGKELQVACQLGRGLAICELVGILARKRGHGWGPSPGVILERCSVNRPSGEVTPGQVPRGFFIRDLPL